MSHSELQPAEGAPHHPTDIHEDDEEEKIESFVTPRDPGIDAEPFHSRSVSDSALNAIRSTITMHSHSSSLNPINISSTKSLPPSNRLNHSHSRTLSSSSISRHKFHEYLTSEMSLIATVIHQHLTATYSHSGGTTTSSRYHHNLHAVGPSVPSSGSKRWKITNFFQSLLCHFETTRNTLPFDDSLAISLHSLLLSDL